MPILILVVQVAIMPRYVKGFKIDREKVANMVGARDTMDPDVGATIRAVVGLFDRSAYLRIECGWVPARLASTKMN